MAIMHMRGDDGPIHLTPEGIERLREKYARLKKSLPDLAAEAARTAAYGDRSDNAEYKEAKGTLRRTQRQVWSIEEQLKRVVPIVADPEKSGVVQLGSTVVLELKSGTNGMMIKKTFQILGSAETDPTQGFISHNSPLGAALINHKKGDVVKIKIASGEQEYRILEIR